jgi:hypothetical protein
MNKDSSNLAGILIFLTKYAGFRSHGIYLSFQRLNETPIFTKHGTEVMPLEYIPNSYAVVTFHEIWYDMPLVIILTSHFLISYNWWKTTCWQRYSRSLKILMRVSQAIWHDISKDGNLKMQCKLSSSWCHNGVGPLVDLFRPHTSKSPVLFLGSFCLLMCNFLLPLVISYKAFCSHVICDFSCSPVFCPRLGLYLISLQSVFIL